jgi:hypothetical protein
MLSLQYDLQWTSQADSALQDAKQMSFSLDGSFLVCVSPKCVTIFRVATGEIVSRVRYALTASGALWVPQASRAVLAYEEGSILSFSLTEGQVSNKLTRL